MMNASQTQRHIPEELAAQQPTARESRRMEGERRVITILFCDVSGSTSIAQHLDPEEWAEIMNDAFDYLITPVYRYEGTVARLMGDGLLAFFGAPSAHEDDPQRAVLAGLDIIKGVQRFRDQVQSEYAVDFNVRVGINTGPVVVGQVGSELAVEYTAMGDAINLASRMEATALPGTVQITEHTYQLVAPLFDVWDVGTIHVKGKAEPVQAYRVLGWQAEPGRTRGIEGLDAPLIGREAEMEALRRALDDLHSGRGGIVCLIGEAGLGKSRLIEELRSDIAADGRVLWLESRGISYEGSYPYGLFLQFIRQNMGIKEDDPPDVVRAKITRGAAVLAQDQRERLTRVAEAVLGVKANFDSSSRDRTGEPTDSVDDTRSQTESELPQTEGEALKREIFATLLGATHAVASQQPTVMVCEDLHWADPASIELLAYLLQLVEQVPILFLCAFREYRRSPAWEAIASAQALYPQQYTAIRLQPLTQHEGSRLVASLLNAVSRLPVDDLPAELGRAIWEKTEGNPFFVEEVVRALIDSGTVVLDDSGVRRVPAAKVEDVAIPDNVQSLLIARIDRLDEETRHVLQLAAVIGRTFHHRVLKELCGGVVELDRWLDALQRAGLVRELARDPEPTYAFRHALTREAAYASILHRRRREFHSRVGEALEDLFSDRLDEEAHQLAYHFDQGRDPERALKYYTIAGDHAARVYANAAAVERYGRAIEIARALSASDARLVHLYTRRGRTLEICGMYDEALANYQELESLGSENADRALELAALIPQATLRSTFTAKFEPERGRTLSERALALARELKDHRAEVKALWNLMLVALYAEDDHRQAIVYGQEALALARTHDLQEELAYTLHDLANAYLAVGRRQEAWAVGAEAAELWRQMGNMPMLVDNLANSAWGRYQLGGADKAIELAREALHVSRSIGSPWGQAYSLFTLTPFYLEQGAYTQAIEALQEAIPLATEASFGIIEELTAALAGIHGFLGDQKHCLELLRDVATTGQKPEDRLLALTILAHVALHHGRPAMADAAIKAARGQFPPHAANPFLSIGLVIAPAVEAEVALHEQAYERVLTLCGEVLRAMDQPGAAPYFRHTVPAALLCLRGQALLALGRLDEAHQALERARIEAAAPDSDRMSWMFLYVLWQRRTMWRALRALSELEALRGNQAAAEALRAEAREFVAAIAERIDDADLRAAFLAAPGVWEVVREG